MNNQIKTWKQGSYAPLECNRVKDPEQVEMFNYQESLLVRPALRENAICKAVSPECSVWIAERLNKCVELEKEKQELRELVTELVTDALSCNPHYTDQVAAIMDKLEEIKGGE